MLLQGSCVLWRTENQKEVKSVMSYVEHKY